MRIAVIGGHPQSLTSFRGELIREIASRGHQVYALAGEESKPTEEFLKEYGVEYVSYPIQRTQLNPFTDLTTLFFLYRFLKKNKIDLVFAYTAKPIIWGGMAARLTGVEHFHAMITGLGRQFIYKTQKDSLVSYLIAKLYKLSLSRASSVIFQNEDDRQFFSDRKIVDPDIMHVVNGSGVDLQKYRHVPLPAGPITFLSIGRLIAEKGFRDYVEAAKLVLAIHPNVRFQIVGMIEHGNSVISKIELDNWVSSGYIEFLGQKDNAIDVLKNCHFFVLASYLREGVPRTILEALATGRPVITTNTVGCRDAVTNGENGLITKAQNPSSLAEAMLRLIDDPNLAKQMAANARLTAEEKYDVKKVNNHMLKYMGLL